ncbi:Protein phosphatase PrpC [Nymphon striatum]|nr:Protein phosphatase PrpC [Nymphon striatum]
MDVTNAISVARLTDIGLLRERNEDAVASELTTGLVMVADGMGGYKGGAIASEIAILVVTAELAEFAYGGNKKNKALTVANMLTGAVAKANDTIYKASQQNAHCEGMGATLVSGVFADNKLTVGHIGDSRLYRLRDGVLVQLTEDHSLLQEQLNAGLITEEQAKASNDGHLVTRALGTDPEVELELHEYDVEVEDFYLLCSDGLTDLIDDVDIKTVLLDSAGDIDLAASNLVKLANNHGGKDNISVVIAFIKNKFPKKRRWVSELLGLSK